VHGGAREQPPQTLRARGAREQGEKTSPSGFQHPSGVLTPQARLLYLPDSPYFPLLS
jgi:hypothetical protein